MKHIKSFLIVLLFVTNNVFAQEINSVVYDIALTESDLPEYTLKKQGIYYPALYPWQLAFAEPVFYQKFENKTIEMEIGVSIFVYENISIAASDITYFDDIWESPAIFYWGSVLKKVIGDHSTVFNDDTSIWLQIQSENIGLYVYIINYNKLELNIARPILQMITDTLLTRVHANLLPTAIQEIENKRGKQITIQDFKSLIDNIKGGILSDYEIIDQTDSKWIGGEQVLKWGETTLDYLVEQDLLRLGRRIQLAKGDAMIGIDVCQLETDEKAEIATQNRKLMTNGMSVLLDDPLNAEPPETIWWDKHSETPILFNYGFPSIIYAYKDYAVHIYENSPYISRGDTSDTAVNPLLFDIARKVAENINF